MHAFTGPWDTNGYRDKSITDDLITDVYTTFSNQTRSSESQAYLRTLAGQYLKKIINVTVSSLRAIGICLSLDNTFKVSAKATVVDKNGTHCKQTKGGILNVINESAEIMAWVSLAVRLSACKNFC